MLPIGLTNFAQAVFCLQALASLGLPLPLVLQSPDGLTPEAHHLHFFKKSFSFFSLHFLKFSLLLKYRLYILLDLFLPFCDVNIFRNLLLVSQPRDIVPYDLGAIPLKYSHEGRQGPLCPG